MNVGTNENSLEMGEPELQEFQDLPPISSYVLGCRFWWKAAMFPLMFILLNAVVFISLIAMDDYEFEFRNRGQNHKNVEQSMI
jgi:hypothetical protein